MAPFSHTVAFFDIGNTLAAVRVASGENRIEELQVFPFVPPVLEQLRQFGVQLGILSDRGSIPEENVNEALAEAGLLNFFVPEWIFYGPKDSPRLFEQAATLVRQQVAQADVQLDEAGNAVQPTLLFVGEDATERAQARACDFLVAPHPRLALPVLQRNGPLRFLRISIPATTKDWRAALRSLPLVPLHLSAPAGGTAHLACYAIADAQTAAQLDDLGFWVDRLGAEDEPLTSDLYFLRDDRQETSGFLAPLGNSFDFFRRPRTAQRVLSSTPEGLLIAIPAGRSVESYHFASTSHGHNLKLVPSPSLLESPDLSDNPRLAETVAASPALLMPPETTDLVEASPPPPLTQAEKTALQQHITATLLRGQLERYIGVRPVNGTTRIFSRHIHHPGNAEAVRALVRDLTGLAAGRLRVRTHRFTHEGRPYDNVEAVLPAAGRRGIVLITAHLDSTGARGTGYRAATDPAPGADDDGSGLAGVLCAARSLLALTAALAVAHREIRFVFFNAEEHGLIGSRAYAREQALLSAAIVAVLQLDMIGFDVVAGRAFELHAGFSASAAVQDRSLRLAHLIAALVPQLAPTLPAPQIYPSAGTVFDPAERCSDHYSFQAEGYAACLATEDFFVGPGAAAPVPEPNPNYHLPADTTVNVRYAADIARAMTAAAWVTATR